MLPASPETEFDAFLADVPAHPNGLAKHAAQTVFDYFKSSPVFRWSDANNDCEDRANAICLLLDEWRISNCKAWVFSGDFRKAKPGTLTNTWNYHVAAALPVQTDSGILYSVIDPATSPGLIAVDQWALQITASGTSYHFIKPGAYYIFPAGIVLKDNWHRRNRRNHNWTMQGLSGINGVSTTGKAQLAFRKNRVKKTTEAFYKMKNNRPVFIDA
ncbi:MAG TPA: protein-glutamine glutaminase family protein [Flavisolibacter sp.]|jgi:hypothetical protein|nr:protein-glutamine glutaminase family protein [Flavisolibacter sp.]